MTDINQPKERELSLSDKVSVYHGWNILLPKDVKRFIEKTHFDLLAVANEEITIEEALRRFRNNVGDKLWT